MAVLGETVGVNVKVWFCSPKKATSLHRTASFDVFCVNVCGVVVAVG